MERLRGIGADTAVSRYLIFGYETAPTTGTPHLQGYVEFQKRLREGQVRNIMGHGVHIGAKRETRFQAAHYCEKDGVFEKWGVKPEEEAPKKKSHTEFNYIRDDIQDGAGMVDVVNEHFSTFIRYSRGVQAAFDMLQTPQIRKDLKVCVKWGPTGVGKTRSVYESHPIGDIWSYTGNGWFDGYHGQPVALFDDFSGGEFKINVLLRILDIYPFYAPVKGSHVWFQPSIIYITSNLSPEEWYEKARPCHVRALMRRLTDVVEYPIEALADTNVE